LVWKAKYWTQGNTPSRTADQWQLLSQVDLGWDAGVVYNGGQTTRYNGRVWKASYWTKGDVPGVAAVWVDIGAATCQ
jgi:chitinase